MDNKKLLQEISRIQEVMGLINEGSRTKLAKGAISVIDDLLGITAKNTDVLAREYGDDGARLLKQLSEDGDNARPIGDIFDDLKKLNNSKAFDDAFEGLKSAFDTIVDDNGVTITQKLDTVQKGVQDLLDQGQNTKAAEYFNSQVNNIADYGDDTLKRFVNDEYFFSIPNFSRANYNDYLKLGGGEKLASSSTKSGKVIRFSETLSSYFKSVKKIEGKITSDIDSYLKLKDEVNKLPIDDASRSEMTKRANRYLDRVEFNLGVMKRKNKETLEVLIEELTQKRNSLPRTSAERAKINNLIERASKEDADVISIWNYLPQGGYKPEGSWYQEMKQLKQERVDTIRKLFIPKKWLNPETADRVSKLGYGGSAGKFITGNVGPALKKLFTDPKKAPRILTTEIGSRLISIPIKLAAAETLIDWAAAMILQDSDFMTEEWIKEHPDMANFIAGFGFDYKDYEDSYWATDMVINTVENTLQNFGITIPALAIKNWMDENSKPGGGYEWWNNQFNKLEELQKSDNFKNASEEEKLKIIEDIIEETDTWVTKASSWWYDGLPPTVDTEINKVLSQIESETTTDDTEITTDNTETTTDDEDSTPEGSGEPGSLDDFSKQLGVELNQVSQDGDIYKWDLGGGVIFNYKLVDGKYVKQD